MVCSEDTLSHATVKVILDAPPRVEQDVRNEVRSQAVTDFVDHVERERRFIVRDTSIVAGAPWEEITQGYVFSLDGFAIRVRLIRQLDASGALLASRAWLTGKGPRIGASRQEYDSEVSLQWAAEVIARCANVVRKRRYQVITDQTWEVDEFLDANAGLWIAELEGGDEIFRVHLPAWAASEIRDDRRFDNEELAVRPFASWTAEH